MQFICLVVLLKEHCQRINITPLNILFYAIAVLWMVAYLDPYRFKMCRIFVKLSYFACRFVYPRSSIFTNCYREKRQLIKIQINIVAPNVSKTGKIISLGEVLIFCENKKIIGNIASIKG